jgi:hypothetical protein
MISAQALEAVTAEELSRAANVFAEMKVSSLTLCNKQANDYS